MVQEPQVGIVRIRSGAEPFWRVRKVVTSTGAGAECKFASNRLHNRGCLLCAPFESGSGIVTGRSGTGQEYLYELEILVECKKDDDGESCGREQRGNRPARHHVPSRPKGKAREH